MSNNSCLNIPQNAIILIPDIGGFTNYMIQADLEHSQKQIGQVLESIIDSDALNFSISEIEGDAVVFYSFNDRLTFDEIMCNCQKMYEVFHNKIMKIMESNSCKCDACNLFSQLKLKFIIHYGLLGSIMIKDFCALYGLDLIVAHRLLKNSIPLSEYILITKSVIEKFTVIGTFSLNGQLFKTARFDLPDIGYVDVSFLELNHPI